MTLVPTDRWADQPPGFNRAAAEVIFKRIMDQPDDETARLYALMLLGGALEYDLETHGELIYKVAGADLDNRYTIMKRHFAQNAVEKTRAGQDPIKDLMALEAIVKARDGFDPNQPRDWQGRWTAHPGLGVYRQKVPLKGNQAKEEGIPKPWGKNGKPAKLSGESLSNYQQAYVSIADWLEANRAHYEGLNTQLRVEVSDKDGNIRTVKAPAFRRGSPMKVPLKQGDTVVGAMYQIPGGLTDNLGALTLQQMSRFKHPDIGLYLRDEYAKPGGLLKPEGLATWRQGQEAILNEPNAEFSPGLTAIRRVGATSEHIANMLPENAPMKLRIALRVAQHAGAMGPEAQKVLGPTADRLAYRYRGTARTPDRQLRIALQDLRNQHLEPEDKRTLLFHGAKTEVGRHVVHHPSKTMIYFKSQVPNPELNRLQLAAGNVPPSRGVIFNRNGQMSAEYVGYADDHYLPFDLKHLTNLKGGDYIRTRTWGGPTTEDIYTGLMTGARGLSVVSNNGIYVVEFDPNLRGGRRFNDKALRMVNRYSHILDAVASKQVTTGEIDPDRQDEIYAEWEEDYEGNEDSPEAKREITRRLATERKDPTFSNQQKMMVAQDFLETEARLRSTKSGEELTSQDLVEQFVRSKMAEKAKAERAKAEAKEMPEGEWALNARGEYRLRREFHPREEIHAPRTTKELRADVLREYGMDSDDPVEVANNTIRAMGLQDKFEVFTENKRQQYVRDLKPMALNGVGYDKALQALKEQFPYYIADVKFYPWHEAPNRQDTGYVMPKHNRPAAAMAGYFAEGVGGGKMSASTIRYQNHREAPALLANPLNYRPKAKSGESQEGTTPGGTGATGGTGGTGRRLSPEAAGVKQHEADLDVLRAVKNMAVVSTSAKGGRDPNRQAELIAGKKLSELGPQDLFQVVPRIGEVQRMSIAEIERLDAAQAHALAKDVIDEEENTNVVGMKKEIIDAFHRKGLSPEPKKIDRTNITAMLTDVNQDIAPTVPGFTKNFFRGDHSFEPEALLNWTAANFSEDLARLGLPNIDDDRFKEAFEAKLKELTRLNRRRIDLEAAGTPLKPKQVKQLEKDALALRQLGQLHRRLGGAKAFKEFGSGALEGDPLYSRELRPGFHSTSGNSEPEEGEEGGGPVARNRPNNRPTGGGNKVLVRVPKLPVVVDPDYFSSLESSFPPDLAAQMMRRPERLPGA